MGNFSVWHWLIGGPFLLLLVAGGIAAYFVLRRQTAAPLAASAAATAELSTIDTSDAPQAAVPARDTASKVVAMLYLAGGAIGIITVLPLLNGVSLDLLSAVAWLVLLAQLAVSVYGGWQFANGKPIGIQWLYWLSWSCVPVIVSPPVSYWCAIGVGALPTLSLGLGHIGTEFAFRFGYAGQLGFNTGDSGLTVGANLVALLLVHFLGQRLKQAGIATWPLLRPNV